MKTYSIIIALILSTNSLYSQYNMQNLTVYDCEGSLKDSESNALNPSWYSHIQRCRILFAPFISFIIPPASQAFVGRKILLLPIS